MPPVSEQRLAEALRTISHAFADGRVPDRPGDHPDAGEEDPGPAAMDDELRAGLGEAALAVAFGAFASRAGDGGSLHLLIASMGLLALQAGEEPDPPAEILAIAAEDARVEAEIDRAGDAIDAEFGREAQCEAVTAALEARLLGTAITLAGCTMPEGTERQEAVRLRAARILARLAAGLVAMNAAAPASAGYAAPQPSA
jgi:hypothetical protein